MEKIDKSRFAWVGSDPEKREGISRPSVTYWKDAMGRLMKNKVAMVCLGDHRADHPLLCHCALCHPL